MVLAGLVKGGSMIILAPSTLWHVCSGCSWSATCGVG